MVNILSEPQGIETNGNENTKTPNIWDSVKAGQRMSFIAIQAYLRKQEKHQINNLSLHLQQLEKEEQKNSKVSRRQVIINTRAEINGKKKKKKRGGNKAKINKTKNWFFEKINSQTVSQIHQGKKKKKGEESNQ